MERNSIAASVCKLAMAGEQAGFTVEQMIRFLNAGMTVETLLDIIEAATPFESCCGDSGPLHSI